ncbi:hypothetical protein WG904_00485 [Pedobacter sp. Du54]|uniref:hypothetical protein n=1 Tax=Pedobacter anseongensis TaxID=3133439 RepID=UPI0030B1CF08
MPDKDFDNLFRDKFIDAEIEPSANLWAKIEDQLEPKRKRTFPIYWMAAASVAVVFTAMLVFQKSERIQLHPDEVTAVVTSPLEVPSTTEEAVSTPTQKVVVEPNYSSVKVNAAAAKMVSNVISETTLKNNEIAMQPNETMPRLDIKRVEPKPIDVLPIEQVENPIVIAQVITPQNNANDVITELDNTTERKGIRNVGDLVNYVVDKVDKRDKKLVRFNTDDDDNSSIIGINIGFLKLNKKNR